MFIINHSSVNSIQVIIWMLQCVCYTSGHYYYNYIFLSFFFFPLLDIDLIYLFSLAPKQRVWSLPFINQTVWGSFLFGEALGECERLPVPITL